MCGSTAAQNQIEQSQQNFMNQVQQQAGSVFGSSSQVFKDLMNTFTPTVAAGPNQQGFSPAELSNLNSQAITQTGRAYKNAKEALGDQFAAQGGGNTVNPSGAQVGADLNLAEGAANQTANELGGINAANWETGRQNYQTAVKGMMGATDVFNPSTGMANAGTGAGEAAANTANQIAQENNSWVSAVTGALGSIAGSAMGGLGGSLFRSGSSGGSPYQSLYNAQHSDTSGLSTTSLSPTATL